MYQWLQPVIEVKKPNSSSRQKKMKRPRKFELENNCKKRDDYILLL